MEISEIHQTALRAARMRALHLLVDGSPKVFVDDFAIRFIDDEPTKLIAGAATIPRSTAAWVLRSRYCEDRLADALARGIRQYVILGAGLDSFAYRNAGSLGGLFVYEVDDPPLQAWKRHRLAELGIESPEQCIYVPCDFQSRSLRDALGETGFTAAVPTFVSWLGVTQYLTRDAIDQTLQWVASLGFGSELVLTYVVPEANDLERGQPEYLRRLRASGVPFNTFFAPNEIEAALIRAGLADVQHLTPDDANVRYFSGRSDALRAPILERLVSAKVRHENAIDDAGRAVADRVAG